MPAPQSQEARRGKLVQGLLWGGVGLAPLAILILLFGQSTGSLRVAVILAVLTIVLIAVSIALRPGIEMIRVDIEHRVLDEMERVRMHTRDDISTASRNTHRALIERIQVLTATVEDLRGQMDEVHAVAMLPPSSPVASHQGPGAPGMVRRTETVHVTRRTTMVGGEEDGTNTGTVYGVKPAVDGEWRERADRRDERPDDRADDRYDDRHDDRREDRHRHGEDRHADDRQREVRPERVERRDGRGEWEGVAAGDRWASVHADDHGREYRVGERRASVRSDGRGTELRVEDRWAALHHEEPPERRGNPYGEADWESTFRSLSQRPDGLRALPAAPGEPPSRYLDDHRDDRHRDDHGAEPIRSRGRERARDRERDWEPDRGRGHEDHRSHEDSRPVEPRREHHDRRPEDHRPEEHRPERRRHERPEDRYEEDRHHEERRRQERLLEREADERRRGDRYDERGREPRDHDDRGHSDRGHDRGYGDRGHDDRGHDSRGYADRDDRYAPRPRSPHPSEYDR